MALSGMRRAISFHNIAATGGADLIYLNPMPLLPGEKQIVDPATVGHRWHPAYIVLKAHSLDSANQ